MSTHNLFKDFVKIAAEKFMSLDKSKPIRLISHVDSDGITAVSILALILNKLKFKYSISIISQLDDKTLNSLNNENYNCYVFIDLGSGQLKSVVSILKNKKIFILDHHHSQNTSINENIVHVNPTLFGIDGSKEISSSGVVYLFSKQLHEFSLKLSYLALIGAIGDQQYNNKFISFNEEILNDAINSKKIKVEKGIRFFGIQTRPIHKLLEYCTDPYIPDVTGNSKGVIDFLNSLKIEYKSGNNYRKLNHLDEDEMKKLIKGIIKKRRYEKNPKDIFGDIFILNSEDLNSPYRNLKEFSTILNACGRLEKASLGVAICMGSKKSKNEGVELLKTYKQEILKSIRWYEKNKKSKYIIQKNSYIIINAQAFINPNLIGTLASIISYSSEAKSLDFIITMAQNVDSTTKISLRYSGKDKIDLRKLIKKIMVNIEGNYGGHKSASGAIIQTEDEKKFIENVEQILNNLK
ncbi:MAG: DHHA1 domain-containing protein [Candidatus Woesearchaeota archaeon]